MNALSKKLLAGLTVAAWALACASGSWAEQKKTAKRGESAPTLSVEQWLEPKDAKVSGWPDLHGQVVVLEFWATWCAPCVAAIPHLNELAEKFEAHGVRFISVSDEDEATVKKFLAKKPIRGWLALDPDKSVFKDYGVSGIPITAVVGRDGTLIALTSPEDVTETVLEEILAGRLAEAQAKLAEPHALEEITLGRPEASPEALFEVLIRPGEPKGMARISPNHVVYVGMELKGILANSYNVPQNRMVVPEELGNTTYDVQVTVPPQKRDLLWPTLRQALAPARADRRDARYRYPLGCVRADRCRATAAAPPGRAVRPVGRTTPATLTGAGTSPRA